MPKISALSKKLFVGGLILVAGVLFYFLSQSLRQKMFLQSSPQDISQSASQNSLQTAQQATSQASSQGKIISGLFDPSKFKTDAEWKKILTPEQFTILREAGTETPFTGKLENETRKGTYYSVGCDEPIFRSEQKYDSGTGWPSFWNPIDQDALVLREDDSIPGEPRVEVLDKCGGHLGHVFDDGPQPTGKRYCMNSAAMYFVPDQK